MKNDDTFDDKLRRFQAEVSSVPSIVDDVMQRIEQKPIPMRRRPWTRSPLVAPCAVAIVCLVGVAIAGWVAIAGRDSVGVAWNSDNQDTIGRGEQSRGLVEDGENPPNEVQGLAPTTGPAPTTHRDRYGLRLGGERTGDADDAARFLPIEDLTTAEGTGESGRGEIHYGEAADSGAGDAKIEYDRVATQSEAVVGTQGTGEAPRPTMSPSGSQEPDEQDGPTDPVGGYGSEIRLGGNWRRPATSKPERGRPPGGIDVAFSVLQACEGVLYQNAKWGFIDRTGKIVIEAKFNGVDRFSEGLAGVTVGDKSGYIDRTGRIVIEPKFHMARPFREGLAVVAVDDKWGYIDREGRERIPPQFDLARDFHEGLAVVAVAGKDGFIDRSGRVVVEPQYDYAGRFCEGLALVKIEPEGEDDPKKRLLGFIDGTGKLVIELGVEFTGASRFSDGLAVVGHRDGKAGFIDRDGKLVIPCRYDSVDLFSEHRKGLARVCHPEQGTASFIDKTGAVAIEQPHWLAVEYYPEADVLVGCYDDPATGEFVQTRFDPSRMRPLCEGLMMFSVDAQDPLKAKYGLVARRWGFGDQTGKVVIEPQFEEVGEFSEGLAAFATGLDWEAFGKAVHEMQQYQKEMGIEFD